MRFAARSLKTARGRAGLTQRELADRSGTSQATVSAYESGAKEPTVGTLERLLAAAGLELALTPTRSAIVQPSAAAMRRAGRELRDVLDLAAALPSRHEPQLGYPSLKLLVAARR